MKALFIHVGRHKIASILLQIVLFHFRKTLRERFSIVFDEVLGIKLSQKIRDGSPKTAELESIRTYMKTEVLKQAETYVISNENLSGSPFSGYSDTGRIAQDLRHLAQDFDRVAIIVFVRRQDTFLEPLLHQQIKMGKHFTFREFLSTIAPQAFDWLRRLTVKEEKSRLRKFLEENFPKPRGGGFDLFTADQRKRLMDGYRDSNRTLFENHIMDTFKPMVSTYY